MQESFNPNKTQSMDSGKTLQANYEVGEIIKTDDGIRTIIVDDVNDQLVYSVRVLHKDGSGKEYQATGPEILLAKYNSSTVVHWKTVRNIPRKEIEEIEESIDKAA